MRLQRFLALAGVASRRAAERFIDAGRVAVNGETVSVQGVQVDPERDRVTVDGVSVTLPSCHAYFMLHKPVEVVTTMHDPEGRRTIRDFLPRSPRVVPVGRLDFFTTGLLLLTNDGDLAQQLTHPRHKVPKTYILRVRGQVDAALLRRFRRGVELDDGPTQPCEVRELEPGTLEVVLREGRNRQVRRMAAALGLSVRTLHRAGFAGLRLGDLAPGGLRPLKAHEVAHLRRLQA